MPRGRVAILYEVWGESKSLKDWAADQRCLCPSYKLLRKRVQEYDWDVKRAILQPAEKRRTREEIIRDRRKKARKKKEPQGIQIKAWGMTKNISEWARESYVPVSAPTLWRRIIRDGWPPEKALMLRPHQTLDIPKIPPNPWDMPLSEYLRRGLESIGAKAHRNQK